MSISNKKKAVLHAVIYEYMKDPSPVGSKHVSLHYGLGMSASSVRGTMAQLERDGYLTHIHTSSGRIPTEKGYRLFIDDLMEMVRISEKEKDALKQDLADRIKEIDDVITECVKNLIRLSGYISFKINPHIGKNVFKKIELIKTGESSSLVILFTHVGVIKYDIMNFESPVSTEMLDEISRLFNSAFKNVSLSEMEKYFREQIRDENEKQKKISDVAVKILNKVLDFSENKNESCADIPEHIDFKSGLTIKKLLEQGDILDLYVRERIREFVKKHASKMLKKDMVKGEFFSSICKIKGYTLGLAGLKCPSNIKPSEANMLLKFVSDTFNECIKEVGEGNERKQG